MLWRLKTAEMTALARAQTCNAANPAADFGLVDFRGLHGWMLAADSDNGGEHLLM